MPQIRGAERRSSLRAPHQLEPLESRTLLSAAGFSFQYGRGRAHGAAPRFAMHARKHPISQNSHFHRISSALFRAYPPASASSDASAQGILGGAAVTVSGRYVYYASTPRDGEVLAPDKSVLLPNATATSANVTNYVGGIDEIALDVSDVGQSFDAGSFIFRTGFSGDPYSWSLAPAPVSVSVLAGAGGNGTSRIFVKWAPGAIKDCWLQVTFTPANDTFYLGNLVADTGSFAVTAATEAAARAHTTSFFAPATLDNPYDFNRDGKVDAIDQLVARAAAGSSLPVLAAPAIPAQLSYDWHTQTINGILNIWAPNPSDFGTTVSITDPGLLFGTDGIPQIESIHQGATADCYLLSAGGALAFASPARLPAIIRNDNGGGWSVTFQYFNPNTNFFGPLVIHTSSQLSSSLQTISSNEIWSLVLEKAFAAFRTWNGVSSTNTMASINWGYGGSAFMALGENYDSVFIGASAEDDIYAVIQADLAAHLPIVYHTTSTAPTMVKSHVYAVTGISTDTNGVHWITCYNPWGFYDTRTETDFLANGNGNLVVGTT